MFEVGKFYNTREFSSSIIHRGRRGMFSQPHSKDNKANLTAPPKGIGAINLPLSVCLSVSLYVSDAKLEELALRIFLIFWIQLGDDKCRKVTKIVF